MATTESLIEAALFARVASLVLAPVMQIAWPNVSFNAPTAGYLRVNHIPNINQRLFLSGGPHQRLGLLQVSVFTPLNQGASAATEIAGKVAAHFPADLMMVNGAVTVRVTKAPDLAQALRDDPHWQVPVTVSYRCFA